jgi:hypothetical protein
MCPKMGGTLKPRNGMFKDFLLKYFSLWKSSNNMVAALHDDAAIF